MVRKRKWIDDSSPDEPLTEVAQRALDRRLTLVWHYLPRAADEPEHTENIHALRVATRRAMAALSIFERLLPPHRTAWMSKQLKRVRQAAGDARDLDVLTERLEQRPEAGSEGPCQDFLDFIERQRDQAQRPIEKICRKLDRQDFPQRQEEFIKRVRLRSKADRLAPPTFFQGARQLLTELVEKFFQAAAADFSDLAALHMFRIQGKELRYAMEIFANAFDPAFRAEVYPLVAALQEKLGKVNDHVTARAMFVHWLDDGASGSAASMLPRLIAEEDQQLEQSRKDFFGWWNNDRASELRQRFSVHLTAPPCEQTA